MSAHIGRKQAIGIGKEITAGTKKYQHLFGLQKQVELCNLW